MRKSLGFLVILCLLVVGLACGAADRVIPDHYDADFSPFLPLALLAFLFACALALVAGTIAALVLLVVISDRHNRAIRAMLHHYYLDPDKLRFFSAGHDCFAVQGNGFTIAKQYGDLGINLRKANTERVPGWAEILRRLGDAENGTPPTLFIHERCVRLIECLPNLQHDPLNPEDLLKIDTDDAGEGGDDPADVLRYLVAQRVFETKVVKLFRPRTQLDRTRSVIAGKPWPADFLYHTE